jgi:hypothetical protein
MDIYGKIREIEKELRMAELNGREWDIDYLKMDLREKEEELKRLEN